MNVEVITIGDEILIGQIINTNAAWIGEQMNLAGISVKRMVTTGDVLEDIIHQLDEAFRDAEFVLITGGLGPTHDDITRKALARFFGVDLVFDEEAFRNIRARFVARGRNMPANNRIQAMIPEGFEVIANPVGTAAGLWYTFERHSKTRFIAAVPGVPHEMRYLVEKEILPRFKANTGTQVNMHRTIRTAGIGESHLSQLLGAYEDVLNDNLKLAFLPSDGQVRMRLTSIMPDQDKAKMALDRLEAYIRKQVGVYIYGYDDDTLAGVVGALLRENGKTISIAESCTGGHVANELTNISGSSEFFKGGIIAYANTVKTSLLGVDDEVLKRDGAVSRAVAEQMALGARKQLKTDIGISTTGIAGPTGGTPEKPVGNVWICYADQDGVKAKKLILTNDRLLNKKLTNTSVLNQVRLSLIS